MDQPERDRIPSHRFRDRPPADLRHPERLPLPGVLGDAHSVVPGERLLAPQEVASYLGLPVKTLYQCGTRSVIRRACDRPHVRYRRMLRGLAHRVMAGQRAIG